MAPRRIDSEIDRLYQLPPDEFTAARNALAKTAGADAAEVRRFAKPPLAAWAVNQLYWKRRDVYDALIDASNELRKIHKAILSGRRADLREASKAHDAALETALKATLEIVQEHGHPATDATRQSALTTLRSLPGDETPGRLTRPLQPGGFEALSGLSIAAGEKAQGTRDKAEGPREKLKGTRDKAEATREQEDAAKKKAEAARTAEAVKKAEQEARRAEFEAVRLTREATKAAKQVKEARSAVDAAQRKLEEAQSALEDVEADAVKAERAREAAERRVKQAEAALDQAQRR